MWINFVFGCQIRIALASPLSRCERNYIKIRRRIKRCRLERRAHSGDSEKNCASDRFGFLSSERWNRLSPREHCETAEWERTGKRVGVEDAQSRWYECSSCGLFFFATLRVPFDFAGGCANRPIFAYDIQVKINS